MALTTVGYKTDSDVVKSEAENRLSRDEITIVAGSGKLLCGAVLALVALGAANAAPKQGGNTGNGAFNLDATNPVGAGAKSGVYRIALIAAAANGGTFRVSDPDGFVLGDVAVGATFDNDIKFVVSDGATDFVVGDAFNVTVAAGSQKYAPLPLAGPNATDVAVLLENVDATSADVRAVALKRNAQVVSQALVWPVGATTPQKTAALAALEKRGVVARVGV